MGNETIEEGREGVAGGGQRKECCYHTIIHLVQLLDFVTICDQHFCI